MTVEREKGELSLILLLTALVAMGVLSISMYIPSLPAIAEDFGVKTADVQITLSAFLFGIAFGQLIYGPLSDRFGRRPIILVGLLLYMLTSLLCVFTYNIESLIIARFLQGLSACAGPVIARAIVRDRFKGDLAVKAFSFIATALAAAPAVAPLIGGFLEITFGWRWIFGAFVAFGMILWILSYHRLDESNEHLNRDALKPRRLVEIYYSILSNRMFMGHALASALIFSGLFSYTVTAPFLFIKEMGFAPQIFGILMIFTVSGYAFGSYLSGRLIGILNQQQLIILSMWIALIGGVIMYILSDILSPIRLLLPMMIYMVGVGLNLPPSMSRSLMPFARVAGSASALLGFFQMAFAGLFAFTIRYFYDGSAHSLAIMEIALAGGGILIFWLLIQTDKTPMNKEVS